MNAGETNEQMIDSKINLLYGASVVGVLLFQQATNYLAQLPDTTLAGIALLLAGFGGVLSYLSEIRRNPKAKLRTNISFAIGIGMIAGLLSYHKLVVESQNVAYWLALILICGFANQGIVAVVQVGARKKTMDLLSVTDADMENSRDAGKN